MTVFVVRTMRSIVIANLKHTILLTIVTVLYIGYPELTPLV